MPNTIRDIRKVDVASFDYIYEENVSVELKDSSKGLVRCNIYRPKSSSDQFPVLVTYGPYGKDVHYNVFHPDSFAEVPEEHHSAHSSWETPDPGFWTRNGYALVRADEIGTGQSPGVLDTMSRSTSEAFFDVIEWAATQPWSSGKVIKNQYGRPGRAARKWGYDTIEGDLPEEELAANRRDQNEDNAAHRFLDEDYYASKDYNMNDIQVPVLSVGNWGGILLHLRGNVEGYLNAGSKNKYLRFITGRHDLPFYSKENVEMQKSFLDAFLKGHDSEGWSTGRAPRVGITLRKGNVGYNDAEAEKQYEHRYEGDWPIPRTQYVKYFLTADKQLQATAKPAKENSLVSYHAPGDLKNPQVVQFTTPPFASETEFTGHIVAHLNVSVSSLPYKKTSPSEIDIFITLRHLDAQGSEIFYTGTVGDPVPVTKGWLRVSLRKVAENHPRHRSWRPHREYRSTDVLPVETGVIYPVDVEVWPTNVVVSQGHRLVLEISSGDTQGAGLFEHNSDIDRPRELLEGLNHIHFGPDYENWLQLPLIPEL
ncbi:hypothetical protein Plec18167_009648 [Paecilomyces lecythidis]|uniref:Xaa-Pro dipeptidyl-peptidase C-terminal domain-containing protein n=1 Tax=Paecilomyces lecythidis TaxID=3004212 RepID=A0ABR3WMD8_9EURO